MDPALIISNIALWVVLTALALIVLALAHQIGTLHERIAPASALMAGGGPKIGEKAPILTVRDVAGHEITIGAASEESKSLLLFFLSPTCPVCKTLLPVLKSMDESERDWLQVILATDDESSDQRAFIKRNELEAFPYALASNLAMTFQVSKLPYAVLIGRDGVIRAKQVVNSNLELKNVLGAEKREVASGAVR